SRSRQHAPWQLNPAQPPAGGSIAATTRWPSKPPASASAKAPVPATPTIMVSAGPVGAEGQPTGGGVDHARCPDRWSSHPVGRDEGGARAQRRGSADTGEAVARQPLPPAE